MYIVTHFINRADSLSMTLYADQLRYQWVWRESKKTNRAAIELSEFSGSPDYKDIRATRTAATFRRPFLGCSEFRLIFSNICGIALLIICITDALGEGRPVFSLYVFINSYIAECWEIALQLVVIIIS